MEQNHTNDERAGAFDGFSTAFKSFATDAIHVGQEPEQWKSMAVVPPISLSTTFKQTGPGQHAVSRAGVPPRLFKAVWLGRARGERDGFTRAGSRPALPL